MTVYWTTTERRTAFELRRAGFTVAEIAAKLPGRTQGAVRAVFAGRGKSPEQIDDERRLRQEHTGNATEACELLRVATITAIARHARAHSVCIDTAARFLLSGKVFNSLVGDNPMSTIVSSANGGA